MVLALTLMMAGMSAPAALQDLPGLFVEDVLPDSAAAKAGLRPGDRIVSYDGKTLASLRRCRRPRRTPSRESR
jgi:serine protease DegQ